MSNDGLNENNNYYILNYNTNNNGKILKLFNLFKSNIFEVFHLCLKYDKISLGGMVILIFFEICQCLCFGFNQLFIHTWTIQNYEGVYNFIQKFLSLFIIIPFFKKSSFSLFITVYSFYFSIVIALVIFFIFLAAKIKKQKIISLYYIDIFNIIAHSFNQILFIQCSQVFLPFFHCKEFLINHQTFFNQSEDFCDKPGGIILIVLSIIGMIFISVFSILFATFFTDLRLKKGELLWRLSPILNLVILAGKFAIIISFEIVDSVKELTITNKLFISGILCVISIFLAYLILQERIIFLVLLVHKIYTITIFIFFLTSFLIFIDHLLLYFGTSDIHCFFQIWIFGAIALVGFNLFLDYDYIKILNQSLGDVTSVNKATNILIAFINILNNRKKVQKLTTILKGFLLLHKEKCNEIECPLQPFNERILNKEKIPFDDENKYLINFIDDLFIKYLSIFPNIKEIRILYCYFSFEYLKKINVAKINMLTVVSGSPNVYHEFALFRLMKFIEEEYLNFEDDLLTVDIASTIMYDHYFKIFQNSIFKMGLNYLEFWNIFIQEELNMKLIKNVGFELISLIQQVLDLYEKMNSISPNKCETLRLYGQFLIDILNEQQLGSNIVDKAKEYQNNKLHLKLFKNDINNISTDGSPVIIANIMENETLIITQATSSITRVFGYQKIDIIGKNVNVLLPKIFKKIHEDVIKKYVNKNMNSKTIIQKHIHSLGLHKSGFIFPIKFILVLLPNLNTECSFAIIIKSFKKLKNYISHLIVNPNFDILYISSENMKLFNFNEKVFWNIKNCHKIKEKEKINLKNYIFELTSAFDKSKKSNNEDEDDKNEDFTILSKIMKEKDKVVHLYDYEEIQNDLSMESNEILPKSTFKTQKSTQSTGKKEKTPHNLVNSVMNIQEIKFGNIFSNFYHVQLEYNLSAIVFQNMNLSKLISPKSSSNLQVNLSLILNNKMQINHPIFEMKYSDMKEIFFDFQNNIYIIDKKENATAYKTRKFLSNNSEIKPKNINNRVNNSPLFSGDNSNSINNNPNDSYSSTNKNFVEISKIGKDSLSSQSVLEEDVYNTLNFKNYATGVAFYDLDKISLTCSLFARPIPKEGKRCTELKNFFEDDTLKSDDDLGNYSNDPNSNFSKAKFEINKIQLFKETFHKSKKSNKKLQILSIIIFITHFIIATLSLIFYQKYINETQNYIISLHNVAKVLNATLTSTNYILDSLIIDRTPELEEDEQQEIIEKINYILKANSRDIYDVISITNLVLTDTTKKISALSLGDNAPLYVEMVFMKSFDENFYIPVTSVRNYSYNEATYELMSSIFSMGLNYKLEVDLQDREAFLICYNSINNFYIKSLEYCKALDEVVVELVPKSSQFLILLSSVFSNLIFFIFLFFFLIEALGQISEILNEFLYIRQVEAFSMIEQCGNYLKNLRINLFEEEDEREDEKEESADKKRGYKSQKIKLRKNVHTNIFIVVYIGIVFVCLILYFLIQYLVIDYYNKNSENYTKVFNSIHDFLSTITLISSGIKIIFFSNGTIPLLNKNINDSLVEQFDYFIESKSKTLFWLQTRQKYAKNFVNNYNTEIDIYPLLNISTDLFNYKNLDEMKNYSIDSAIWDYYNNLKDFFNYVKENDNVPIEILLSNNKLYYANRIYQFILNPYYTLINNKLSEDFEETTKNSKTFVIIWYSVCFVVEIVLFFGFWKPVELNLQNDNNKTKFLLLLVPNKMLMNKKSMVEILKREKMINSKK